MAEAYPWESIDDYLFVKLVGELLGRLGFIDIDYQGNGPDGGIDLFATELLPFALKGRSPFRWAIQCKFSEKGARASVNDREIQDVEGILRSERYLSQAPQGYALVTNRKIVQNVVERLRGIDRNSSYRTARVDNAEIVRILGDHPKLASRYFGSESRVNMHGRPGLIATPLPSGLSSKVIAAVPAEIRVKKGGDIRASRISAIIDTGAEVTCIPESIATLLDAPVTGNVAFRALSGVSRSMDRVTIDLAIERLLFENVSVIATPSEYVSIGMDLLHGLSVSIEPDGAVVVYSSPGDK